MVAIEEMDSLLLVLVYRYYRYLFWTGLSAVIVICSGFRGHLFWIPAVYSGLSLLSLFTLDSLAIKNISSFINL